MDRETDDFTPPPMLFDEAQLACGDAVADNSIAQQVADFLGQNPDFFVQRGELLRKMTPPPRWSEASVVDLQSRRLEVLKGEMAGLRECAVSVIETSRANLATQAQTHAAVLKLLEAESIDDLLRVVSDELPELLGVDIARLAIEAEGPAADLIPDDVAILPPAAVDSLLGGADVLLLPLITDDGTLFGPVCDEIASAALVRLPQTGSNSPGLLVFGATEEDTFYPRQGTELIRFLAEVVARCFAHRPLLPIS